MIKKANSSKQRILMIGNYLSSPRHNRNVWQALAERLTMVGWDVITTSSKESQFLRLLDMLADIIFRRKDYDLAQIDVFSGKAFIFAECCAGLLHLYHKPIILTLHGGGLPAFAEQFPKRVSRLFSLAAEVITPSPFLQQSLSFFCNSIRVIPNGIDLSQIPFKQRDIFSPKLIWVRAFHETYNPELAIRVLSGLSAGFPDARLIMAGPDKGDGSLQAVHSLAAQLGVQKKLQILPAVPYEEVPSLLEQGDIFINTTNYDTAPRSLLEAMANGACVVSTNVGGVPWMVTDRYDSMLVPPDDEVAMVDAIKELLWNQELAAQVSLNARRTAELHDWSMVLPEWEMVFRKVLTDGNESC